MKFGEGAAKERAAGGEGLRWIPVLKPHAHLCSLPAHQVHPSGQAVPSSRETEPFCKVGVQEQPRPVPSSPSLLLCARCLSGCSLLVSKRLSGEVCDCCTSGLNAHFLVLPAQVSRRLGIVSLKPGLCPGAVSLVELEQ